MTPARPRHPLPGPPLVRATRTPTDWLSWALGILAAATIIGAMLAFLAVGVSGCGGKRHLATAEGALAGYELLHWTVCLDGEPLLSAEACESHYQRLRALEQAQEGWYAERARGLAGVIRVARPYVETALRWIWPWLQQHSPVPLPDVPVALGKTRATRAAASGTDASVMQLELVRRWSAPPPRWDRVRLYTGLLGELLIARPERGRAFLERQDGSVLEQQPVRVTGKVDFFPTRSTSTHLLLRSEDWLYVAGHEVARAAWETYFGFGDVILAWWPCVEKGCPFRIFTPAPTGGWQAAQVQAELFGGDLALMEGATGSVAIATRESPTSAGWTLRIADWDALKRGVLTEIEPRQVWEPEKNISLEDPRLVRGTPRPILIGGAAQKVNGVWTATGRIYLAEADGALRVVLTAAAEGNDEPGAAVFGGRLYVAAQLGPDESGLWGWVDRQGLQLVATAPGGRPSLAAAEGRLWLSTTTGLYALPP